jgi:Cft2 family RNA processing exonuclease
MKRLQSILACGPLLLASACIHIKTDPVDVHMTVDVNVKVDRALDSFFGDLDKKSTTIVETPGQK